MQVIYCLKRHLGSLHALCRQAVTMRQIDSSKVIVSLVISLPLHMLGPHLQVVHCLKQHKGTLHALCRDAVTMRQIDSSEDISLDPYLAESCTGDRNRLCNDVG